MPVLFLGHGSPMNAIQDNACRTAEHGLLAAGCRTLALGRQLKALRHHGVLIVGSGNIVHNLRATQRGVAANQAYDWAMEFDGKVAAQMEKGDLARLADFQKLGQVAQLAHPTHEHYLPLLYAAGAVDANEPMRFFNSSYKSASISMRSAIWG